MDFLNMTRKMSNSSASDTCSSLQPAMKRETNLRTVMPILLTIVAVTNNLLVMFLVFCTKQLRKNINFYIVNMAVSDMITSLVICMRYIVSYLYEAHGILALNDILCKVFIYIKSAAAAVSLLTLLVISSDRYRAVSCPLNVAPVPRPCFVSLVLLTWIIPGAMFVYEAVNSQHVPGRDLCKKLPVSAGLTITEMIALPLGLFLYLCMIVLNIQVLRKLCQSTARLSGLSETEKRKRNKKFRSAARMVLCSIFLSTLCTCPGFVYHVRVYQASPDLFCSMSIFLSVWHSLLIANSALGPVVYLIFLQDFREAFKNRFCLGIFCVQHVRPAAAHHNTLPCHQTRTSAHQNNPVFEPNDSK